MVGPKTIQEKVLANIINLIEATGYQALVEGMYSNTGRISIQHPDRIQELGKVGYNFQCETVTLWIKIGKTDILSQPPRTGYYDFLMRYDGDEYGKTFRPALIEALKKLPPFKA